MIIKLVAFILVIFLSSMSFAGDIWVYDAKNQKIGILIYIDDEFISVFLPSLNRLTKITIGSEVTGVQIEKMGLIGERWATYYQDSACAGTPGDIEAEIIYLHNPINRTPSYRYSKIDLTKLTSYEYVLRHDTGECSPYDGGSVKGFPTVIVPSDQIPFATPISFPVKFQYNSSVKTIVVPIEP